MTSEPSPQRADVGLRVLSMLLGVFLLLMGMDKLGWLADSAALRDRLLKWLVTAPRVSRFYLEHFALPGAPVFARLVVIGEAASGIALILGVRVRLAAAMALFMVVNFHVAAGVIFDLGYLTNGYGPPVLGGLLALAIGGARLPFSVGSRPDAQRKT